MLLQLLYCLLAGILAFSLLFVLARRLDNYGIVDVAWSLGFAPLTWALALLSEGWLPRRLLFASMVTLWSLRLGLHLWARVAHHHPEEDARYRKLREEWGAALLPRMFRFFLFQALALVLLAAPFVIPMHTPQASFSLLELLGLAVWLSGLLGESLADRQLAHFKKNPALRGRVCDTGLWRLSRHPNYFFEWLVWLGYALFILSSPGGWWGFSSAALMLLFLTKLTGIRYTEEQLLRSKGEPYRAYQARTSAFIPWFPRSPRS